MHLYGEVVLSTFYILSTKPENNCLQNWVDTDGRMKMSMFHFISRKKKFDQQQIISKYECFSSKNTFQMCLCVLEQNALDRY